jgi:hypothetical protein
MEESIEGVPRPPREISAAGDLGRRYVAWWLYDLPPMHGLLRLVFYGGLFWLAMDYPVSPLRGIETYRRTSPELFRSYGLIDFLEVPHIEPAILHTVIRVTKVAWILAAIGLFTRVSAVVTAAGVIFLHGMFLGSNALNQNWYLPTYALIALCFTRTPDPWSVDWHLKKWWTGTPPKPEGTLADTGLARKAVLVLAAGYYFSAGITKLWVAGPGWADGHTIAYFASERGATRPMGLFLAQNMWLCTLLAVGTLALELGAPAALFSRRARYVLIPAWICMHVGIRLAVGPRYWENTLCFALLIDWGAVGKARRPLPSIEAPPVSEGRAIRGVAAASLLLPLVAAVAFFSVSWWPLTCVYMYSSYFSLPRDVRADRPRADYHEAAAAQRIARAFHESSPPIEATEYFAYLAELRLAGGGTDPVSLARGPGASSRKQWMLTIVRPVLIEDLAAKPPGRIELDPERPDYPAQRFLLDYLPVFRRHADPGQLERYERLELTYPLESGPVVIASVPLGRGTPAGPPGLSR